MRHEFNLRFDDEGILWCGRIFMGDYFPYPPDGSNGYLWRLFPDNYYNSIQDIAGSELEAKEQLIRKAQSWLGMLEVTVLSEVKNET